jgi:hypothetical protein
MSNTLWWSRALVATLLVVCIFSYPLQALSEPASSNFKFDETAVGVTGQGDASSTSYTTAAGAGDIAVGTGSSTNFQNQAGSHTTPDPTLSVQIINANASFGSFSPGLTATATASFSVVNYTSYGYAVIITGDSLKNGTYTIPPLATTSTPLAGVEQFGVNIVANTSPLSFGANPDNGGFGYGVATANYGTADHFRFVSGESIASAPKSSGKTIYTLSYIANVNGRTPGGQYAGNQTIIVTGTY